MAWKLKTAQKSTVVESASDKLRSTVAQIILDVETCGDAAVRDYSVKFDGVERDSYRLSDTETCLTPALVGDE